MMVRVLGACAAAVSLAAAAFAQDDAVMEHYAAYNEAVAAGDAAAADTHGEAAWRAAEEAWGGVLETGIMALNLATLRVTTNRSAEALEPARRVFELAEADVFDGAVDDLDVVLLVRFAEAASDEYRSYPRLQRALQGRDDAGLPDTDISALAWLQAAQMAAARNHFRKAAQYARRARNAAPALGERHAPFAIQAARIEGASRMRGHQYEEAMAAFRAGQALLPPEAQPANSQLAAEFRAWIAAARAGYITRVNAQAAALGPGSRAARDAANIDDPDSRALEDVAFDCGSWRDRRPPVFPWRDRFRGQVGAVVVVYSLAPNGSVVDARIAAEVPERSDFGEAVIVALRDWRYDLADPALARCFEPRELVVEFAGGQYEGPTLDGRW